MYFLDTGLCSHIMWWPNAEVLERISMDGAFFETWVVSEIYKSYINNGKRPPLYFYRDSNKRSIADRQKQLACACFACVGEAAVTEKIF